MTLPQIIKTIFPEKSNLELGKLWHELFEPELSGITGRPTLNIIRLDDLMIEEYGEYQGSMKDNILKRYGADFLKEFNEVITI